MNLVYFTSYTFPSRRAEPYYVRSMAEAFASHLGTDFSLVIRGNVIDELKDTNAIGLNVPDRMRTVWYLFWFPFAVRQRGWNYEDTTLMSNDPNLLLVFIFWKKLLKFKYRICSDWHQLFDNWKDEYIAQNSNYLITTCKRLASFISQRCKVDSIKIIVAYGGIDPKPFAERSKTGISKLRQSLGLPESTFLIGYVGGWRSVGLEKGLDTMIRALPYLPKDTHMVLVGGTKEDIDTYKIFSQQLQVEDRTILVGKQTFEKVIDYELSMDVLVIPYPDKHHFRDYGFPMKVWEYMASGRPIVYSRLAIIDEVLEKRGTPFRPDDAVDLASVIASLREDWNETENRGAENSTEVHRYTWRRRAEVILESMRL